MLGVKEHWTAVLQCRLGWTAGEMDRKFGFHAWTAGMESIFGVLVLTAGSLQCCVELQAWTADEWDKCLDFRFGMHACTAGTDWMRELSKQDKNPSAHSGSLTHKERAL